MPTPTYFLPQVLGAPRGSGITSIPWVTSSGSCILDGHKESSLIKLQVLVLFFVLQSSLNHQSLESSKLLWISLAEVAWFVFVVKDLISRLLLLMSHLFLATEHSALMPLPAPGLLRSGARTLLLLFLLELCLSWELILTLALAWILRGFDGRKVLVSITSVNLGLALNRGKNGCSNRTLASSTLSKLSLSQRIFIILALIVCLTTFSCLKMNALPAAPPSLGKLPGASSLFLINLFVTMSHRS